MPHVTRYDVMPIPPVEAHTEYIPAGTLRIGVEYRLLDDAIVSAHMRAQTEGAGYGDATGIDDRGVSLHVFAEQDGEWRELLRFDCFVEDPHYHYLSWRERANEMIQLDPVADGDPLAWALERIHSRLPQMLERAGAADVARRIDFAALEAALPRVTEAAFRARYQHDDAAVRAAALAAGGRR
jgi:hypothetical protein